MANLLTNPGAETDDGYVFANTAGYTLSGAMEMDLEIDGAKTRIILAPGDRLRIVPGTKHRMIAVDACDVLEVSTPELHDVVRLEDRYGRAGADK